jgi:regulator of protease activity HflC (stomatin/prohibitin superfamily)
MPVTLAALVAGLILTYLSPVLLVTVPAGHVGVIWYRFGKGTELDSIIPEGTSLKNPWNIAYVYDTRFQAVEQRYDAITSDGLLVQATVSLRFRIVGRHVGALHKNIGSDYLKVLLIPEIGVAARNVIAEFTAEELYATYRSRVSERILTDARVRVHSRNSAVHDGADLIEIDQVMLQLIELPERVEAAIESKIEQYQKSLEYDFRLRIAEKEARRKAIEGEGVHALFDTIGKEYIGGYLRMIGIDATLELARSDNAKIIIGGGMLRDFPLIFGNPLQDTAPPSVKVPGLQPGKPNDPAPR